MIHPDPERQKEIGVYMAARNWVAEWNEKLQAWFMMKEPYYMSSGPFEVLAIGRTLEQAFDKAKERELK